MTYERFSDAVAGAGLVPRKCSDHHWQILGGPSEETVNCWPNSKKGFRYQVGTEKSRTGTLGDAIRAADPYRDCVPWVDPVSMEPPRTVVAYPPERERVGLIRWFWRLLW